MNEYIQAVNDVLTWFSQKDPTFTNLASEGPCTFSISMSLITLATVELPFSVAIAKPTYKKIQKQRTQPEKCTKNKQILTLKTETNKKK